MGTPAPAWPDSVDAILEGDQAVVLATVTPASGVVLTPVTNFGVRDREAGTYTLNSSTGAGKKLARLRRNPHVGVAFHTREHGRSGRTGFVLLQGAATLSEPIEDYPEHLGEAWDRAVGPPDRGPVWGRLMRGYHRRVEIEIAVRRLLVWPGLDCAGEPEVHGEPLPGEAPRPQPGPASGRGPRLDHEKAATAVPPALPAGRRLHHPPRHHPLITWGGRARGRSRRRGRSTSP